MYFVNLIRTLVSDVFNGHASCRGVDEDWHASGSVQCETQVHFLLNCNFLHQVYAIDGKPIGSRLFSDEMIANVLLCNLLCLLRGVYQFHSALKSSLFDVSHASATSEDLALDNATFIELGCDILGFISVESHLTQGNGHVVLVQKSACLIFMKFDSSRRVVNQLSASHNSCFL